MGILRSDLTGHSGASWNRYISLVTAIWIAIPVVSGLTILLQRNVVSDSIQPSATKSAGIGKNIESIPGLRTQSCAASNCHGSLHADNSRETIRADEYHVWLSDPHAQAYRTLFGERSRMILQRLAVADSDLLPLAGREEQFTWRWQNCLACHESNSQLSVSPDVHTSLTVAEGVSCESCHGGEPGWLHGHYRPDWKSTHPPAEPEVIVEARRCVVCHVGSQSGAVDHDLIAAGHPAMRFEYVWYKSRLPKHWNPDRAGKPPIKPGRDWIVGQLVSARAALDQLEHRSRQHDSTWPELSDFNCSKCHHNLKGPVVDRPATTTRRGSDANNDRTIIPWGNWNLELLDTIASHHVGRESLAFRQQWNTLRSAYAEHSVPRREAVTNACQSAKNSLDDWIKTAADLPEETIEQILKTITQKDLAQVAASWDQSANLMLGFAAQLRDRKRIPESLYRAVRAVKLPEGFDSPADFGIAPKQDSTTDLPTVFRQLSEALDIQK